MSDFGSDKEEFEEAGCEGMADQPLQDTMAGIQALATAILVFNAPWWQIIIKPEVNRTGVGYIAV